jgi:photosystem II stability/assembly factor-like uncharacterized protein
MKYLHHFLILFAASLLLQACKSESIEDVLTPVEIEECNAALNGWTISTYPLPWGGCYDADFPTDEIGYIVGNQGLIFKTTDGGQNWVIQSQYYSYINGFDENAVTKAKLNAVSFVDEMVGFIGGETEKTYSTDLPIEVISETDAVLLKTNDGGVTWVKSYLPEASNIYDLHFFDASNGMALVFYPSGEFGGKKRLMMTDDGGATWAENVLPFPDFAPHGFYFSGNSVKTKAWDNNREEVLLTSLDNGKTWQTDSENLPICSSQGIIYVGEENGFAYCWNSLAKTTDGGKTWKTLTAPVDEFHLVHFSSANDGFIITENNKVTNYGDAIDTELLSFYVCQTRDGGKNWDFFSLPKECDYLGSKIGRSNEKFYTLGNSKFNVFEMQ